jgi:hypothetical protein
MHPARGETSKRQETKSKDNRSNVVTAGHSEPSFSNQSYWCLYYQFQKNHTPSCFRKTMNDMFAIVPASALILLVALRKIAIPIKFNEEIFGEIHPDEVHNSATMRMLMGAGFGSVGLMGLILGFSFEAGPQTEALLYAMAAAFALILGTLLFAKQRGYLHEMPTAPMVIFPGLIALCLAGALI